MSCDFSPLLSSASTLGELLTSDAHERGRAGDHHVGEAVAGATPVLGELVGVLHVVHQQLARRQHPVFVVCNTEREATNQKPTRRAESWEETKRRKTQQKNWHTNRSTWSKNF